MSSKVDARKLAELLRIGITGPIILTGHSAALALLPHQVEFPSVYRRH